MAIKELIKTDRNGTKYWNTRVPCDRCGGDGVYKWGAVINGRPQYVGTCFKCNGAGKVWDIVKEYAPEYRAKLDAANAKRRAKQEAKRAEEQAKREAERREREAQWAKEREERRKAEEARKAISQFVGNVGERITAKVTLDKKVTYEVPSFVGFGKDTKWIYIFVDESGNKFVWKTSRPMWFEDENGYEKPIFEGDSLTIKGTVKDHTEYKGEKQTEIQRVKAV